MNVRDVSCQWCRESTAGDCGNHGPKIIAQWPDIPRAPEASDICSLCGEPAKNHGNFGFRDHAFRDVAGKRWDIDWSFPSSAASPGAAPSGEGLKANIHGIGPDTDGGPNPDYRPPTDAYGFKAEPAPEPSGEGERLIRELVRDVGTVVVVASRRSDPDSDHKQMLRTLREWESRLWRISEAWSAEVASLTVQLAEAREETEKYRIAASVLCGAHIGVPQSACPVCQLAERDATIGRLTHRLLRPSRIVHPQRSQKG